jgi:hypothetical protein
MGLLIGMIVFLLTHREKTSDETDSEVALED